MRIEIKKIKLGPGSQETIQFTAELYVNSVKIGDIDNNGGGASTNIRVYGKENRIIEEKAEEFLKQEALEKDPNAFTVDGFIADLADNMACKLYNEKVKKQNKNAEQDAIKKALKTLDRKSDKSIILVMQSTMDDLKAGKLGDSLPFSEIRQKNSLSTYNQVELKKYIDEKVIPNLKPGQFIYNKNLPK